MRILPGVWHMRVNAARVSCPCAIICVYVLRMVSLRVCVVRACACICVFALRVNDQHQIEPGDLSVCLCLSSLSLSLSLSVSLVLSLRVCVLVCGRERAVYADGQDGDGDDGHHGDGDDGHHGECYHPSV